MKMKVLLTKPYFKADMDIFKESLNEDCELVIPSGYSEEELIKHSKEVQVLLGGFVSKDLLMNSPMLELIQVPWTGMDKFNFEAMEHTNAVVCNSHSNSAAVAELSVALFLSAVKNIPQHDTMFRGGNWNRPQPGNTNEVSPFSPMISSLKIGILGFGAIGSKIYEMLGGFNSRFHIYNTRKIENLGSDVEAFYEGENIEGFLSNIDVLFICLPLTEKTKNLLTLDKLKHLRKTSYIINTARGEIVNEDDLFHLLSQGGIRGAAIDTWWRPPSKEVGAYPSKNEYHLLKNIVMSPHRAGMVENDLPHLNDAISNINNLCEGLPLKNIINFNKKY